MKIQLETYQKKYTVETENEDLDIYEYLDIFKGLLVSSGFMSKTFDKAIIELANELININAKEIEKL